VVHLLMDSLAGKYCVKDLLVALETLPEGINRAYDEALRRIEDDHKAIAYQIFSWLTYARRPLSVIELQHALAAQEGTTRLNRKALPDKHFITSICVGLVEVTEPYPGASPIVTLVR
jgi:hypothetical protein